MKGDTIPTQKRLMSDKTRKKDRDHTSLKQYQTK